MGYYASGRNQVIIATGEPIVVTIPRLFQQWVGMDSVAADNVAYHFQVSTYPSFSGLIFNATQISSQYTGTQIVIVDGNEIINRGNVFFFPIGLVDESDSVKTTFYWRVQTGIVLENNEYEWSAWSTIWQFQVNKPPSQPEIASITGLVE